MEGKKIKIRNGFRGEKLISLPTSALEKFKAAIGFFQLYVTHIGYFPNALYHYRLRKHGCEDDILFYCLKGKGYYKLDNARYCLKANQFVIIPATTQLLSYWADPTDPWTIYWVHFTSSAIGSFNQALGIGRSLQPVDIPYNNEGLRIWDKMYESISSGYTLRNMLNMNLCLPHLIATFVYPEKHLPAPVYDEEEASVGQSIRYMKNNIGKRLTVEDMACLEHVSVSYFSKLFRKSTGMSPIDYFIRLKMQEACHLLRTTDLRIKQIAAVLGYEDPYYFSRLFKKNNNNSPEEFRAVCRDLFVRSDL